jgi:hypothetical protein
MKNHKAMASFAGDGKTISVDVKKVGAILSSNFNEVQRDNHMLKAASLLARHGAVPHHSRTGRTSTTGSPHPVGCFGLTEIQLPL